MKIGLTLVSLLLIFHSLSNRDKVIAQDPFNKNMADTVIEIKGKLIDSFKNSCSRYAECICAEYARILIVENYSSIKLENDTIGLLIYCPDERIKILKDSLFKITATTKFQERILISGHSDTVHLKVFWSIYIRPWQEGGD